MAQASKPKKLTGQQSQQHQAVLTTAKDNLRLVIDQVESLKTQADYSDLLAYLATCVEMFDEEINGAK